MLPLRSPLTILVLCMTAATFTPRALGATQANALYSFGGSPDGNYPAANLVFDSAGNLYGTTVQGGTAGYGVVFELKPTNGGWSETILYDFCQKSGCIDGATPFASLVVDSAGNLYGTTYGGGEYGYGTAFRLSQQANGSWIESVIRSFGSGTDGKNPFSGLVLDKAGNLYGTTFFGGASTASCSEGCGTAFELSSKNGLWTEKILYSFCSQTNCSDGIEPAGSLAIDSSHNLYGTTEYGGTLTSYGTVFQLTKGSNGQWMQKGLHTFAGGTDGANPLAGLTIDAKGGLYGATQYGGAGGNNGTIFALTHNKNGGWKERVLYSFCSQLGCSDGSSPLSGVAIDKAGHLYGATISGGSSQSGLVFELAPGTNGKWTETILFDFSGGTLGFNPHASVILDSNNSLYGVTYQGGSGGFGTAYEIIP
jgi:uncharacterized repeat protein (TIGR03803 family)